MRQKKKEDLVLLQRETPTPTKRRPPNLPALFPGGKLFPMKINTFRLKTGAKLRESIQDFAKDNKFTAGLVLSVVGSLKEAKLRMAGATPKKQVIKALKGDYEVVSVQGTLSADDCHIHISVSDKNGKVVGGHLKEGTVALTAEVSLLELTDRKFLREFDKETGFEELVVE